jgi:hypothetical protein
VVWMSRRAHAFVFLFPYYQKCQHKNCANFWNGRGTNCTSCGILTWCRMKEFKNIPAFLRSYVYRMLNNKLFPLPLPLLSCFFLLFARLVYFNVAVSLSLSSIACDSWELTGISHAYSFAEHYEIKCEVTQNKQLYTFKCNKLAPTLQYQRDPILPGYRLSSDFRWWRQYLDMEGSCKYVE